MENLQDNQSQPTDGNKEENNPVGEGPKSEQTEASEDGPQPEPKEAQEVKADNTQPVEEKSADTVSPVETEKPSAEPSAEKPEKEEPQPEEETAATDEDLENEDDTQEVESDDESEEHPEELELPDYAEYQPEKLVSEAEKLLAQQPAQKLKDHFEAIRKYLLRNLNEERAQKLEEFKEQGGNEIDFEFIQPLRERFKKVYGQYRHQRKKYYQELSDKLELNLKVKKELIEKLKNLVNKEESIGKTFKEFNEIRQEWRNTGPVPRAESHNLWQTWHHHVHNFYEYIDINKELRDLDYKKNRAEKEELIAKAKELLEWKDQPKAFKLLQELHKEWKHVGPVEPDLREKLWDTFSDITKELHDKREAYFQELREAREILVGQKRDWVEKIKAVATDFTKHHQWQKAMKEVQEYSENFKKIGRLNHPDNDPVWEDYREAMRHFNHQKNEFYKNLKKEHQVNLEKKRALVAEAEALKDSEDWRETANKLKKIQADWKIIGHVPKKESDKIWKTFRAACNHFFDRLTEHNKGRDQELEKHLEAKNALLAELKEHKLNTENSKEGVNELKDFINRWRKIGAVPRGKGKIEKQFNDALDAHFAAIDLGREEANRIRFENKMKSLEAQGGDKKLKQERRSLRQNIEEAKKELGQLETNMSFFSSSDPKSPIVKEAQKKIKRQQELLDRLEGQMKMLNVEIRQLEAEQKKEETASDAQDD